MTKYRIVIVTGLSGSGKSTAIKALEDIGFFCIDNLPILFLDKFLTLSTQSYGELNKFAFVMDAREPQFMDHWRESYLAITRLAHQTEILFLDASDEAIIRRFSETRRKHPLGCSNIQEGIRQERELFSEIKKSAHLIIDTSSYSVHKLKKEIQGYFGASQIGKMDVTVMSFGYKFGIPQESDYVFDVRFLLNPFFIEALRPLSGNEKPVKDFVLSQEDAKKFIGELEKLLTFVIPLCINEGKSSLTISVGCTGGKHRSVVVANELLERLSRISPSITVIHRDRDKP